MRLGRKEFLEVVDRAPLVSIDLIVRDANRRALLGKRTNEPARGCWFVPGGRIYKDERLEDAFRRICLDELGVSYSLRDGRFLGVYEHFYTSNFAEQPGVGTHYVVLAYEVAPAELPTQLPAEQHGEYRWFDVSVLLEAESVHVHSKAYFRPS